MVWRCEQGWWVRARQGLFQGWQSFKGFLLAVCSSRERPLHFIKLQMPSPTGEQSSPTQLSPFICIIIIKLRTSQVPL